MKQSYATALVMATLSEAKPFIKGLGLKEAFGHPFPVFGNVDLIMVICGIGKANAAMGTTYCCITFGPVQIVNLGAAGAVDGSAKLGDVYQISKVFEPDRPSFKTMGPAIHIPDTLGDFPTATLATHDRPIIDPNDRMDISQIARLVDMEAASVVQTCRKFNKKCSVFKFVSDTPDHTEGSDIIGNIKRLRSGFFNFFYRNILPKMEN